jgi:hypothetical protein
MGIIIIWHDMIWYDVVNCDIEIPSSFGNFSQNDRERYFAFPVPVSHVESPCG